MRRAKRATGANGTVLGGMRDGDHFAGAIKAHLMFAGHRAAANGVNADFLLMTSYHEAAPMVIDEAVSLGLPIVTTRTTSTREMVLERNAGWECENTQDGINNVLTQILGSSEELEKIKEGLSHYRADNRIAVEQFRNLVE